jgi:L-alanine-DL-glutamate epimerase-like enolase superfamily enzyme
MRTGLLAGPLEVTGGRVAIPAGPGLGIEVDESAVRALDRLAGAGGGSAGGGVR